jgi:glycogen synthase
VNVVLVNPEYPSISGNDQGGIATYTYCMANALVKKKHNVHVLVKNGTTPRNLSRSVKLHEYHPESVSNPLRLFYRRLSGDTFWESCYSKGLLEKILDIHKTEPVDIVEIPEYNGLAHEFTGSLPFPVIIHFHTPTVVVDFYNHTKITVSRKIRYAFEKNALSNAIAFRSPSNALADEVSKLYHIKRENISVIRYPFDTADIDKINKEHSYSKIDILFAGRLERRKGAELLVSSIKKIVNLDNRIRFTLAGEQSSGDMGNYRDAIERNLDRNERMRVFFLGPVKREDLEVLYCRSDILCFPSIFENMPYTVIEAMAAGLPVIASNRGGLTEIIKNNQNGLLFNPDNIDEFVACVKNIVDNHSLIESISKNAYDTIKQEFDSEKISDSTIDFFQSAINKYRL